MLSGGPPIFERGGRHSSPMIVRLAANRACPRCKAPMIEVLRIAPVQNDPGLIAYECPSCGYVTSVLLGPKSGRSVGTQR
jgi:hypothetical protein